MENQKGHWLTSDPVFKKNENLMTHNYLPIHHHPTFSPFPLSLSLKLVFSHFLTLSLPLPIPSLFPIIFHISTRCILPSHLPHSTTVGMAIGRVFSGTYPTPPLIGPGLNLIHRFRMDMRFFLKPGTDSGIAPSRPTPPYPTLPYPTLPYPYYI